MAKIFLMHDEDFDDFEDERSFDDFILVSDPAIYPEMLKWLVDNDMNFHSQVLDEYGIFVLKDEDAVMFKLKWG